MKIYVGNLPHGLSEQELNDVFAPYGSILSARIIKDKFTGESRGFGFVEMGENSEAEAAINALNGAEVKGRRLRINEARPPEERTGGFGGDRQSRGGFGGRSSTGGFGGNRDRFNR